MIRTAWVYKKTSYIGIEVDDMQAQITKLYDKKNADHLLKGLRSKLDEMKTLQVDINNQYSDVEKLKERGENTNEVTKNDLSKLRQIQSALSRTISRRKETINQLLLADKYTDTMTSSVEVATLSNEEMDKLVADVRADDEDFF